LTTVHESKNLGSYVAVVKPGKAVTFNSLPIDGIMLVVSERSAVCCFGSLTRRAYHGSICCVAADVRSAVALGVLDQWHRDGNVSMSVLLPLPLLLLLLLCSLR
jgi:hypothetical protein